MNVVLVPTLVSDNYAPQRAECASLPRPTAPLVTELLQLPVQDYGTVYHHISEMMTYRKVGSGGHWRHFCLCHSAVWTILTAPSRNNLTYLFNVSITWLTGSVLLCLCSWWRIWHHMKFFRLVICARLLDITTLCAIICTQVTLQQ